MSEQLAFYLFGAIALVGGVNVVFRRNPVHAALFLVAAFLGMAGLFVILGSGFLAAIQVMVYAGAIMVLFLFVILLLNLEHEPFEGLSAVRTASALVAVATILLVILPFLQEQALPKAKATDPEVPATAVNIGQIMFKDYVLHFEIISLLLLVAMVGAIHLAKRPQRGESV